MKYIIAPIRNQFHLLRFIPLDDEESDNEKLCRLANDMESSINIRLGRSGVRWAGETKMPIQSKFWHILQKHIALRKANK